MGWVRIVAVTVPSAPPAADGDGHAGGVRGTVRVLAEPAAPG
ncbi:MAG: hypothetical protein NTZ61_20155 [Proteobacteria bacterium]|nr:hypothetical protein [Pseudomonadota bacterium]